MRIDLKVPKVNANDEFVKVVDWYFKDKEFVKKGDMMVDFETSKSIFEFESEFEGYIYRGAEIDETVAIGQLIGFIFSTQEEINEEELKALFAQNKAKAVEAETTGTTPEFTRLSNDAKAYAETNNVDVAALGLKGLVTKRQILAKLNPKAAEPAKKAATKNNSEINIPDSGLRSETLPASKVFEIEQLGQGQRDNLTSSLTVQINTDNLFNNIANEHLANNRLPVILYELSKLLKENPKFCSYYNNGRVHYYDEVSIGVALDLDNQLKVPVIQHADNLSIEELSGKVEYFINCYLNNKFSHRDLIAGSFTVTDLSGENILSFQPLINGAQSAILGIGMDSYLPGKPMTLTMVFDHKVHSGMDVANLLNQLKFRLSKYGEEAADAGGKQEEGDVVCCKCFTTVEELYEYYESEALMTVHINAEGKKDYICHICAGGY